MAIEVGGTVQIESRYVDDHTLVALSGPLSLSTAPRVGNTLTKLLARDQPVVVDLSGLDLGWRPAVEVFATALQAGGVWPLARMVLFGADADLAEWRCTRCGWTSGCPSPSTTRLREAE